MWLGKWAYYWESGLAWDNPCFVPLTGKAAILAANMENSPPPYSRAGTLSQAPALPVCGCVARCARQKSVVKDQSPEGLGSRPLRGFATLGEANTPSGASAETCRKIEHLCLPVRQHVPSPLVRKSRSYCHFVRFTVLLERDFTQCLSAPKNILTFLRAW